MEYYIYLTNDCNQNCSYCSVLFDCQRKGIPLTPQYTPEALLAFVDDTQKSLDDDIAVIIFFGGEPTLEYSRMETYMSLFSSADTPYAVKFVLHTNGLLLNKLPHSVGKGLDLVILSLNYEKIVETGPGGPYFSRIIGNTRVLRKYPQLRIMARLTISATGSLYTETLQCEYFFDYVYWQIENCHAFSDFSAFYRSYTCEMELTFSYWLQELERGRLLPYIPFLSVLREMICPSPDAEYFCCSYDSAQLYLQTDGKIYSCCDNIADNIPAVGSMDGGFSFRHPKWTEYERCRTCRFNAVCRGRCGRMHREFSDAHIEEYCALNRFMFELFENNRDRLLTAYYAHPDFAEKLRGWQIDITELTP